MELKIKNKRKVLDKKLSKVSIEKLKKLGVAVVYFFGSRVEGTAFLNSDYDIGVVFSDYKKAEKEDLKLYIRIYSILAEDFLEQIDGPKLDISFLQRANAALQMKAISEGAVLLAGDPVFRADYEESVIKKYDDYRSLQKEYEEATFSAFMRR